MLEHSVSPQMVDGFVSEDIDFIMNPSLHFADVVSRFVLDMLWNSFEHYPSIGLVFVKLII